MPIKYNFGYIAVGGDNDDRTTWEGFWTLEQGRPNVPEAEIIRLDGNVPPFFRDQCGGGMGTCFFFWTNMGACAPDTRNEDTPSTTIRCIDQNIAYQ